MGGHMAESADQGSSAGADLITPANLLTFSRLILLPVVIVGIATKACHGYLAVVSMVAMWITDLLDGRIARLMGQAGPFGKALDSTVDFVLIYALFIAFYAAGRLETYQFAFLYLGMVTLLALQLSLTAAGQSDRVADTPVAKLTGALQYAYLLFLVALEVIPRSEVIETINLCYFTVLAIAIVINSVLCILEIAKLRQRARST